MCRTTEKAQGGRQIHRNRPKSASHYLKHLEIGDEEVTDPNRCSAVGVAEVVEVGAMGHGTARVGGSPSTAAAAAGTL